MQSTSPYPTFMVSRSPFPLPHQGKAVHACAKDYRGCRNGNIVAPWVESIIRGASGNASSPILEENSRHSPTQPRRTSTRPRFLTRLQIVAPIKDIAATPSRDSYSRAASVGARLVRVTVTLGHLARGPRNLSKLTLKHGASEEKCHLDVSPKSRYPSLQYEPIAIQKRTFQSCNPSLLLLRISACNVLDLTTINLGRSQSTPTSTSFPGIMMLSRHLSTAGNGRVPLMSTATTDGPRPSPLRVARHRARSFATPSSVRASSTEKALSG
mmetsp:Transcript_3615/g.9695  ORF Transcript_3615/g.9695 Transcript_3615/m.9695 type:complete len:269 (+) Transcript_3615:444-1250(+)